MTTSAAHRLAGIRDRLTAGEELPEEDARALADALDQLLRNGTPIERSLGLCVRGGVSLARANALAERDAALRRLWRTAPEWRDLPPAAAARLMSLSAQRYETTRWPRERDDLAAPSAEPAATWWQILNSGVPIPAAKRLQIVLEERPERN